MPKPTSKIPGAHNCTENKWAPSHRGPSPARQGLGRPSISLGQLGRAGQQQIPGYYRLGSWLTLRTQEEQPFIKQRQIFLISTLRSCPEMGLGMSTD